MILCWNQFETNCKRKVRVPTAWIYTEIQWHVSFFSLFLKVLWVHRSVFPIVSSFCIFWAVRVPFQSAPLNKMARHFPSNFFLFEKLWLCLCVRSINRSQILLTSRHLIIIVSRTGVLSRVSFFYQSTSPSYSVYWWLRISILFLSMVNQKV